MQTLSAVLVTLTMLMAATVDAKLYERCELAVKMEEASLNGFMGYGVGDWLCTAHYESGFDTSFVDHNPDGSSEYDIFQLNSAWWCDNGVTPTQNLCHIDCHDLLNGHILDYIVGAKQVLSTQNGMKAWNSWSRHCYDHDLSEWIKGSNMHAKTNPKKINS
ncbi:sperm acrosome-associated protein 5-like [Manis javanica]|uniref:sperm acrosome-associated protein 5-like n=1 Tax=Manis javanica TaxID=9974 RepID=UPI00081376B5|nr:sperm acrosome-associated protein 5-like [Manis javanica]